MPVTAKFSEAFYRKMGHEAVDELVDFLNRVDATYRGDLREVNERNFARFEAKLDALRDHADDRLEAGLSRVEGRLMQLVEKTRADMITWMFVFVATAVLIIRFS